MTDTSNPVIAGVRTISHSLSSFLRQGGPQDQVDYVLGKMMVRGASEYIDWAMALHYVGGTKKAKRAEAVVLETVVRRCALARKEDASLGVIGENLLGQETIEKMLQNPGADRSILAPVVSTYILDGRTDTRMKLTNIGECLRYALFSRRPSYACAEKVDLSRIHRNVPPVVHVLYEEITEIEQALRVGL